MGSTHWRRGAVVVSVTSGVGVAVNRRVDAAFGEEGGLPLFQPQASLPQQIGEHGIVKQPQLADRHLQGDMPIAEVVGRPQQLQGVGGAHQQQRFSRSFDLHQGWAVVAAEPFAGLERFTTGQLQQQGLAAAAVAQAPQPGAFVGTEGQGPGGQSPGGLGPVGLVWLAGGG